jgi:toxin ParE1/3/4
VKPASFHPDARQEAEEAADRYEGIRPGLGFDFRDDLEAALTRIRDNPLLYAAESGSIRIAPLHRFPYSLIYEDMTDRVWIAAVAHHSRRPGYWKRRQPI